MLNIGPMNDSALVRACLDRDLKAWSMLVDKYSNLVSTSIKNRVKRYGVSLPAQDIEDIRQDVFASIWKDNKLSAVTNRDNISYWLAIVSGNKAILHLRKKETRLSQDSLSIDDIDADELSQILPLNMISPGDETIKNEISSKIDEAIELLSVREKLIIKLNLVYDKKYHEIADMLGLPKGTVSNYIKRAKERLKRHLRDLK